MTPELKTLLKEFRAYSWSRTSGTNPAQFVNGMVPEHGQLVYEHMYMRHIEAVPLIRDAPIAFKKKLCCAVFKKQYPPEAYVIREGMMGEAMYFVIDGECTAQSKPDPKTGAVKKYRNFEPPNFFGEASLSSGKATTADVVTSDFCDLLVLTKAQFEETLEDFPEVRNNLKNLANLRVMQTKKAELNKNGDGAKQKWQSAMLHINMSNALSKMMRSSSSNKKVGVEDSTEARADAKEGADAKEEDAKAGGTSAESTAAAAEEGARGGKMSLGAKGAGDELDGSGAGDAPDGTACMGEGGSTLLSRDSPGLQIDMNSTMMSLLTTYDEDKNDSPRMNATHRKDSNKALDIGLKMRRFSNAFEDSSPGRERQESFSIKGRNDSFSRTSPGDRKSTLLGRNDSKKALERGAPDEKNGWKNAARLVGDRRRLSQRLGQSADSGGMLSDGMKSNARMAALAAKRSATSKGRQLQGPKPIRRSLSRGGHREVSNIPLDWFMLAHISLMLCTPFHTLASQGEALEQSFYVGQTDGEGNCRRSKRRRGER
jgi:CRP-like cAMP-binding protein